MGDTRSAHENGATRVSVDGLHVLTGGSDGVVAFFPLKKWPQSTPRWARKCHDAAVTCVALHDALGMAFSSGRDGKVILHENIHDVGEKVTSRDLCRVTGEIRFLCFDATNRRLFLGGNSFRCLQMNHNRYEISAYPLPAKFVGPFVAASVSNCGRLVALANTSGHVAVVPTTIATSDTETPSLSQSLPALAEEEATTHTTTAADQNEYKNLRVVLENTFTSDCKKEDAASFHLSLVNSASGMFLFVPTLTKVNVFKLSKEAAAAAAMGNAAATFRLVATLEAGEGVDHYRSAIAYRTSPRRIACVISSPTRIVSFKLEDNQKCTSTLYKQHSYTAAGETSALSVCPTTGDVAVGLSQGEISCLFKFSMKVSPEKEKSKSATTTDGKKEKKEATTESGRQGSSEENNEKVEAEDDDEDVNVSENRSASPPSSSSSSSASSSSSSNSDSDYDSDTVEVKEDLNQVVEVLKMNGGAPDVHGKRPSAWRKKNKEKAEKDAYQRMNFMEDEALEATSSEEDGDPPEYLDDYDDTVHQRREYEDGEEGEDEEGEDHEEELADPTTRTAAAAFHGPPAVVDYAFQVGATPVGEEGSCYLAYNSTGYILHSKEGTTVYFHDISHSAVPIARRGVLMGALSPVGAGFVLAPPEVQDPMMEVQGDGAPRLSIYFRTFTSLGAQSEWQTQLLPEETVRCMTAGIRYLAVATSRYLRIFSLSGLELAVLSKFPRIVTMAGTSSEKLMRSFRADFDPLAVCFLDGVELKVEVLDVGSRTTVIPSRGLPLTEVTDGASHQLQWLGWSEDGPLHTVDTAGVVRLFTESWGGSWIPVYDPRTALDSQHSNLWVWGVNDEVLLAYRSPDGATLYPSATPSGLPTEHVRLSLPLTRTSNERERIVWDHLIRREIRTDEIKRQSQYYTETVARHDAVHDKKILELFNAALKDQQTTRALDLATMLELRDSVAACTKAANEAGQERLVHQLLSLYELRVKSRQKRKCTLPLEGSVVSEKDRDLLLRKLLKERKEAERGTTTTTAATADTTEAQKTPEVEKPAESSPPRRHISFQLPPEEAPTPPREVRPPPPPTTATTATTTKMRATTSSLSTSTATSIGKETTGAPTAVKKPLNPFQRKTTMMMTNNTATTTTTNTASSLLGESPTEEVSPMKAVAAEKQPVDSPSPSSRPSAAHAPEKKMEVAVEGTKPKNTFVPVVKPVASAPTVSTRRPADPFLEDSDDVGSHPESGGDSLTTIQGLLDVGHEDSGFMPRTKSFGMALRKRYREEDEEESSQEALPMPILPPIA